MSKRIVSSKVAEISSVIFVLLYLPGGTRPIVDSVIENKIVCSKTAQTIGYLARPHPIFLVNNAKPPSLVSCKITSALIWMGLFSKHAKKEFGLMPLDLWSLEL